MDALLCNHKTWKDNCAGATPANVAPYTIDRVLRHVMPQGYSHFQPRFQDSLLLRKENTIVGRCMLRHPKDGIELDGKGRERSYLVGRRFSGWYEHASITKCTRQVVHQCETKSS